jgi:hypothetical protein
MPGVDQKQFIFELRESSRRLRRWVELLISASNSSSEFLPSSALPVPTPEQMSGVLSELLRAGEYLRSRPKESNPALEDELADYRRQLERLRDHLPLIHRSLLNQRARLEHERECVQAAAEWARASRQTLSR